MALASQKLEASGLSAAAGVLPKGTLYVEKHRLVRLAPYIVHASLLIIFAGAILDGTRGYKGFVNLRPGSQHRRHRSLPCRDHAATSTSACVAMRREWILTLTALRKQYWSQLTVLENGREVAHKKI